MAEAMLVGRSAELPFLGYFQRRLGSVAWAGAVARGADPVVAFQAARALDRALARGGDIRADRRRALSILWARLEGVDRTLLGPSGGQDLVLLLCGEDDSGGAVSGVGLGAVYALGDTVTPWIAAPHPLLGPPGLPVKRPGVLTVDALPVLVGLPEGNAGLDTDPARVRVACGDHP